jgi:hypothetical protein
MGKKECIAGINCEVKCSCRDKYSKVGNGYIMIQSTVTAQLENTLPPIKEL